MHCFVCVRTDVGMFVTLLVQIDVEEVEDQTIQGWSQSIA